MEKAQTITERFFSVQQLQEECTCGSGIKVMYICNVPTCPSHLTQPLYCIQCDDKEDALHQHKPKAIVMQGGKYKDQWQQLRKEASSKTTTVKEWLERYHGLLDVMDGLVKPPAESLHSKMKNLIALEADIQ